MKWIIFNNSNINQYINFIDSHKSSGIWHYPSWLKLQLEAKKAIDGFLFGIEDNNEIILAGLYLVYRSGMKFNYGYIPAGFLYKSIDEKIYAFFLENINNYSQKKNIVYTQLDSIISEDENFKKIINLKKNHSIENIHLPIPMFTTKIMLDQSDDEILNKMKPKGRYNIKLASKKGVTVKKGVRADIKTFFSILEETSSRDGFSINPENYYDKMLEFLPEAELLLAYYENKIIAGGIFSYTKNQGLYYYGASSSEYRNLMSPYLLQWEAMLEAKKRNCLYYDFLGISDPDKEDKLAGVTDFKLKFGGEIVKFNPSYHIIHKKVSYSAFKLIKKLLKK